MEATAVQDDESGEPVFRAVLSDITERMQAEQEIARLATFPILNPQPIVEVEMDGRVCFVNPAARRLFPDLSQLGRDHPWLSNWDSLASACREHHASFHARDVEVGGQHYHQTMSYVPEVRRVRIYGEDVTEQKRAERLVCAANALLSLLPEKLTRREYMQAVVELLRNWTGCRCAGIRGVEEQGRVPYEAYAGFSQEFWRRENLLALRRDECACTRVILGTPLPQDAPAMTPGGSFVCQRVSEFARRLSREDAALFRGVCINSGFESMGIVPLRHQGQALGAIHLADETPDMLPLKKVELLESLAPLIGSAIRRLNLEEAIRRADEQRELALEAGSLGTWDYDIGHGEVYWDERCRNIFGVGAGEKIDYERALDIIHPDERQYVREAVQEAIGSASSGVYKTEYRVVWPDGSEHWVAALGQAHFVGEGADRRAARFIGTVMDVTEKKFAENILVQAKAAAEQANRAKDHFLAVLSHELRTPLTPVVMGVSMLQDRTDLDPGMREMLETIRRNIEMETHLIDDLLDASRIARGKIELKRGLVELSTVIDLAIEVCKPDIEARRLHFGVDLGPAAPCWIEADAPRLQQVFWNLLRNAVKFTPHDGRVGIRCRPEGTHVVIEVHDSGIGIEPDALPRVFDAFEQVERSITREFGGLGLGLAICKALVEMHGGTISAHSEGKGKGATFRIRLPLATLGAGLLTPPIGARSGDHAPTVDHSPTVDHAPTLPAVRLPHAVRPLRILLVEDHSVTAKIMRTVLTKEGHTVETAGDLAAALELAGQQAFDLLVSDLGLPDGSGHDLMRQLRHCGHEFPGIALSGYGMEEDIQRSREAGFAAHLTKPASRDALVEAVASVTAGN